MFIGHLLCSRHYFKHITYINSFNPRSTPQELFKDEERNKCGHIVSLSVEPGLSWDKILNHVLNNCVLLCLSLPVLWLSDHCFDN